MEKIISLIAGLTDPLDYQEYILVSTQHNLSYWGKADYAQKLGLLMLAMFEYPNDSPYKAFIQLLNSLQKPLVLTSRTGYCCGGGTVK